MAPKITVLTYHSVDPTPDPVFAMSPDALRRQLQLVRDHYQIVRLKDIKQHFEGGGQRKVIVTFDDGFRDFLQFAYPVLEELGVPATLFVPTGFIGGWNTWAAHYPGISAKRLLTAEELRLVHRSGLVDIGSHSVDHVSMRNLPVGEMYEQARGARRCLEDVVGTAVTMFSYPYGRWTDFSPVTERVLADTGHDIAVTSCWSTRNRREHLLQLRRVNLETEPRLSTARAKIEGYYDWIGAKRYVGYVVRSALKTA